MSECQELSRYRLAGYVKMCKFALLTGDDIRRPEPEPKHSKDMANYDIRKLQLRLLDILLAIDKVCREHGLRYCICGGTMLGAVRHGGFIPWDDDLDISMPRPDYDRLIAHAGEWLPKPFELVCAENGPSYPLPFAKVQDATTTLIERKHLYYLGGIYVDIFPFDAWPENAIARRRQAVEYFVLKQLLYQVHRDPYKHGHGPSCWLPLAIHGLFNMSTLQRRIRRVLRRYDYETHESVSSYTDGLRKILPKSVIGTFGPVQFEGHIVQGIVDYDTYLRCMYGDYMTIPPVEKRVQHNFHYLDLNNPYKDYKPAAKQPAGK